ncbi:hypothetical protein R55210_AODCCCNP_01165 [Fructobacillus fructosus]|uniref:hypothetical protein n=1 Tax=Fructobacillus fructosus TaxID=1631 RepID=UPI002D8CC1C0|nr:hypothetical protein R55210_AODCCCNP_01165 [Fructobacillus fructosus]
MDFNLLGVIVFVIGMVIFLFGKQFILLRLYFGDRSVFSQLFWGTVISAVGVAILYFNGSLG